MNEIICNRCEVCVPIMKINNYSKNHSFFDVCYKDDVNKIIAEIFLGKGKFLEAKVGVKKS